MADRVLAAVIALVFSIGGGVLLWQGLSGGVNSVTGSGAVLLLYALIKLWIVFTGRPLIRRRKQASDFKAER